MITVVKCIFIFDNKESGADLPSPITIRVKEYFSPILLGLKTNLELTIDISMQKFNELLVCSIEKHFFPLSNASSQQLLVNISPLFNFKIVFPVKFIFLKKQFIVYPANPWYLY